MFFVGIVSELVKNFNIRIFSDTINVINATFCMMVLYIKLYLLITLPVTLTLFQGRSSVK